MNTCRFEMQIKGRKRFYCAAKFGPNGWAYLWAHDGFHDPCKDCRFRVGGKPLIVHNELPASEWAELAGKQIRRKDWIEFEKRGISNG